MTVDPLGRESRSQLNGRTPCLRRRHHEHRTSAWGSRRPRGPVRRERQCAKGDVPAIEQRLDKSPRPPGTSRSEATAYDLLICVRSCSTERRARTPVAAASCPPRTALMRSCRSTHRTPVLARSGHESSASFCAASDRTRQALIRQSDRVGRHPTEVLCVCWCRFALSRRSSYA
jgi:hypothetical protein